MHLSQGFTYHLSILQYLCALAELTTVHLMCLDSKTQISNTLQKQFGQERPKGLIIHKIKNRYFGLKSNTIFFRSGVIHRLGQIINQTEFVAILTRNVKIASFLFPHKLVKSNNCLCFFECHQIFSINLAIERKFKDAHRERILEDRLYRSADLVFTNTLLLKKILQREYSSEVVNLPVAVRDDDIFDEENAPTNTDRVYDFVYAGTFSPWKGVEDLFNAFQSLSKSGWQGKALLVGFSPADMTNWRAFLKQTNLTDQIILIGRTPRRNISGLLDKCKIGVVPNTLTDDSILGTSPLKLFDYAARGLTLVVSRVPALLTDIDLPGLYWAEPENSEELAKTIRSALDQWTAPDADNIHWAKNHTWSRRAQVAMEAIEHKFIASGKVQPADLGE